MSKLKYIFNPISQEFDAIQDQNNTSAKNITQVRNCLASVDVLDLVVESNSIVNGVDSVVDNNDIRPVMGVVIKKISDTRCEVLLLGTVGGFTGLTKGSKVFLNTDGTVTSNIVTTGYLQTLGTARDVDTVDFNPQINRVKRS